MTPDRPADPSDDSGDPSDDRDQIAMLAGPDLEYNVSVIQVVERDTFDDAGKMFDYGSHVDVEYTPTTR